MTKKEVAAKIHATLGASTAARWMACPGSVNFTAGMKSESTGYAREGTAAHTLGELVLGLTGLDAFTYVGTVLEGVKVTEDMAAFVNVYVDYARELQRRATEFWIEKRFNLAALHPPIEMFGTGDCIAYEESVRQLEVVDLKFGQGVTVEVQDNPQLMYYALGALLELGPGRKVDKVKITIVQPRVSHADGSVRSFTYTLDDLMGFANRLMDAAVATQAPNAALIPGSHCRWCPASGQCPAQYELAQKTAMVEFASMPVDIPPEPATLPDSLLAEMLPKLDLLEHWIKAMRNHAVAKLERGEKVEGFKLVERRANRKWIEPLKVTQWMMDQGYDQAEFMEVSLPSPAKLERIVGKKNLPIDFTQKVSSGSVMVPTSDPRPEKAISAADEFAVLTGNTETD